MSKELLLAAFIIGVGLCIAGAATHLYQAVTRQQAMLRMDGATALAGLGHLALSFVCGPYLMLQMGWQHEEDGTISVTSMLVGSLVAFGWAFVSGLLFMSAYVAVRYS
jgi:cytochrome c biogenesis protein CcdA